MLKRAACALLIAGVLSVPATAARAWICTPGQPCWAVFQTEDCLSRGEDTPGCPLHGAASAVARAWGTVDGLVPCEPPQGVDADAGFVTAGESTTPDACDAAGGASYDLHVDGVHESGTL
jgi:hypothetical protein